MVTFKGAYKNNSLKKKIKKLINTFRKPNIYTLGSQTKSHTKIEFFLRGTLKI